MSNLQQDTLKGLFWSSVDKFSVQGISFVIQIIIARILLPEDYGLIGMLAIFLAVSQIFIDSGFNNALIQKHNRTETDYSTVFYFNIVVAVLFYLLLFFASPLIADFYHQPILEKLTKIVGLVLIINSLSTIQRTKLTINIDFKTQAKISIVSIVVSGVIGVVMAYNGYGVWSLVMQSLLGAAISTVMFWIYAKWIPKRVFSYSSFKTLFSFGSKLLASGLLDTLYKNIYTLIIGKKFSASSLGIYSRADQFAQFPSSNLTGIIGRVTYPILCSIQTENDRLKNVYRQYLRLSAFIVFPLMIALCALSAPTIDVVLGTKWHGVILWLQILCFSAMWYPIHAINLNLLQVKGRSDLFLRLEIIKKIIGVAMLFITVPIGITAMCVGGIITSLIALVLNTHYTGKLIDIGFFKQMKDLIPSLLYSLSMGVIVFFAIKLTDSNGLKLLIGLSLAMLYYLLIAYITKSTELKSLVTIAKDNYGIIKNKHFFSKK
ncbi:MAG: lipopolysaccharide biosynthesis protein [Bacteroidales bacterium]|jgi:O-antigen/teichoic acid export membrane protein|nr:lipopolysaccharide biosynthesis protein [Bacteroidales bacterium]